MTRTWMTPNHNISVCSAQPSCTSSRRATGTSIHFSTTNRSNIAIAAQSDNESSSDESWDEEETLVSMYLSRPPERDITNLVDGIENTWAQQRKQLEEEIIHVLIPAFKKSKHTQKVLDEVDSNTIDGVQVFADACQKMEAFVLQEQKQVQRAFEQSGLNLKQLHQQLQDAYMRKQAHWDAYSDSYTNLCLNSIKQIRVAPSQLEETIASIEKKGKNLHKKAHEKLL